MLLHTVQPQFQNAVGRITHELDGEIRKKAPYHAYHLMRPHADRLVAFAKSLAYLRGRGQHTEKGQGPLLWSPRQGDNNCHHASLVALDYLPIACEKTRRYRGSAHVC